MSIERFQPQIKEAVDEMYQQAENEGLEYTSIIFYLDGDFYMSIYDNKVKYIFDVDRNLYQNILFELQIKEKLSILDGYHFYVDNISPEDVNTFYSKRGHKNSKSKYAFLPERPLPKFEPSGKIYEIEEIPNIFDCMDIMTDHIQDKTYSKEEIYSLMITPSFKYVMSNAVPVPIGNEPSKPSRYIDLSDPDSNSEE